MKVWLLLIIMSLLFACSDISKGKQLKEIDAIVLDVDSIKNAWEIESDSHVDSLSFQCKQKINAVSTQYNSQEIDLLTATNLDQFKFVHEDLLKLQKVDSFFESLLDEKLMSLQLLRDDISKGTGRREKYNEYISFEKKELNSLLDQFNDYKITKKNCLQNYEQLQPFMDSFLLKLQTTNR